MRQNQVIEALRISPKIASELPYNPGGYQMSLANRRIFMTIKPVGRKSHKSKSRGRFITVYYLEGDEGRAVEKFVEINKKLLDDMDLSQFNLLHSGLPKGIAKKIIDKAKEPRLCECGCGEYAKPGKRFIYGHKIKQTQTRKRKKQAQPRTQTQTLRMWVWGMRKTKKQS